MIKPYSVTTTLTSGPQAITQIHEHTLIMDQPTKAGGNDTGPTPVDAFLATIGACLGTISRMVAKQQNIQLDQLKFIVSGSLDIDILLGRSSEGRAGFQDIKVDAYLESPDLDEMQKKDFLAEVDRRCPVSETVLNGTPLTFNIQ